MALVLLMNVQAQSQHRQSFFRELMFILMFSCIVFGLINPLFGLVAFILAGAIRVIIIIIIIAVVIFDAVKKRIFQ